MLFGRSQQHKREDTDAQAAMHRLGTVRQRIVESLFDLKEAHRESAHVDLGLPSDLNDTASSLNDVLSDLIAYEDALYESQGQMPPSTVREFHKTAAE